MKLPKLVRKACGKLMPFRLSPPVVTAIHLASLTVSVLLLADVIGLVPDNRGPVLAQRRVVCESLAIHCSLAVHQGDSDHLASIVRAVVRRNPEVVSAAVRKADGAILSQTGDHAAHWKLSHDDRSLVDQVQVPIVGDDRLWGTVEVCFQPFAASAGLLPSPHSPLALVGFVGITGFLAYLIYLRRSLRRQSGGIPERVRNALNTLVEGILVVNREQKIALANDAFAEVVGCSAGDLEGQNVSEFRWKLVDADSGPKHYPWTRALRNEGAESGTMLDLQTGASQRRTFLVNAAPINADDGTCRGAIASFDDVTVLRQKQQRLRKALERLRESRARIRVQNRKLQEAASQDALTYCLNRRAFFEELETHWVTARQNHRQLSCLMIDVDRFKSINDRYGHRAGDEVLRMFAAKLKSSVGDKGSTCRYGGEEFCVVLPGVDIDDAFRHAEQLREQIAAQEVSGISVTASFGVSSLAFGATQPSELVEQADRALYAAKRAGRNRTIRWDPLREESAAEPPVTPGADSPLERSQNGAISFHTVASLLWALGYRNADSAEHSRRVADLAVEAAEGLMTHRQRYLLEVAALLHDIGKIGVPDRVLLKPGPLSEKEWVLMHAHEHIGAEIVSAAFACPELTSIVAHCHVWYGGHPDRPHAPTTDSIPLAARILSIADAFDSMVSDRVYRKAISREDAFAELRRFAGTQFDPRLVERFIQTVLAGDEHRNSPDLTVSKQAALKIGRETEKLADALDNCDLGELTAMATHLKETAAEQGVAEIAEASADLETCLRCEPEFMEIVRLTGELLDLCRATQRACLPGAVETPAAPASR